MNKWIVITSINCPNNRILEFIDHGYQMVVAGDKKTDDSQWEYLHPSVHFLSFEMQEKYYPELSLCIGPNNYARKNIGYLFAVENGAETIWETDDDTFCREGVGDPLEFISDGERFELSGSGVWNPYKFFAPGSDIWPRGYPLRQVLQSNEISLTQRDSITYDILQTLVNREPDIDAIYRLTRQNTVFDFLPTKQVLLMGQDNFAPGNTQSTFWLERESFKSMYFPISVSNRFGDILKMYIAQSRHLLAYSGFLTEQFRNAHDYFNDFELEIPMYLQTDKLLAILSDENNVRNRSLSEIYADLSQARMCDERDIRGAELFESRMNEFRYN